MAKNKIIYGNTVLIDLSNDTVTEDVVLDGYTFHGADGEIVEGTCTYDADTKDATAKVAEVLSGSTFYKNSQKLTGTMPNIGKQTGTISTKDGTVAIQQGYHDGSGSVAIDATEKAKIIGGNIKAGVSILGEEGTYTGEEIHAQTKNATPYTTSQVILPGEDYDYLSQVNIAAIKYVETPNEAGGITVTIGDVAPTV